MALGCFESDRGKNEKIIIKLIFTFFSAFIRLKGRPFNCGDDISAYYEIEDCGEFDELRSSFHDDNLNCKWENGPNNGQDCNEFNLQEFGINDGVGKSWYGLLDEKGQLISKANSKLLNQKTNEKSFVFLA